MRKIAPNMRILPLRRPDKIGISQKFKYLSKVFKNKVLVDSLDIIITAQEFLIKKTKL